MRAVYQGVFRYDEAGMYIYFLSPLISVPLFAASVLFIVGWVLEVKRWRSKRKAIPQTAQESPTISSVNARAA
jgi:hypothetical protein